MNKAYIHSHNIISALGSTTDEVVGNLKASKTGIKLCNNTALYPTSFQSALINKDKVLAQYSIQGKYTLLEKLMIASVTEAIKGANIDISSPKTIFIFSTTKGNVDALRADETVFDKSRAYLSSMASEVAKYFGNSNSPVVVSQACISGVLAVSVAGDYLRNGIYDNAVVIGGDLVTEFTISGFMSFMAISSKPCKPYDVDRDGISIGEAVGTIILSKEKSKQEVKGGSTSNDANHISGPSRTGDGLFLAIDKAMKEAGVNSSEIDYLSAHGTATNYNDEMESKAFTLAKLSHVPMNSLKGYWGHCLGAAGVIEIIAGLASIEYGELYSNIGLQNLGVSGDINVIREYKKQQVNTILKTASGFGGCNAAIVISKA
jgi:3-oxoacyl-[acyl-carrier-protein] synthase-1